MDINIKPGQPAPLGASIQAGGINFALFSAHATSVTLCLFSADGRKETHRIALPERSGDIWHGFIEGLGAGQLYGYRVDGPYAPDAGHRFNAHKLLIDPYAKALKGQIVQNPALFGYDPASADQDLSFSPLDSAPFMPKSVACAPVTLSKWKRPARPWSETLIYEAHVKGLSQCHPQIPASHQGRFRALGHKALRQHFKMMGVTALELLPVQSFFTEPRLSRLGLTNYWGYNPVNFFVPHAAYGDADDFRMAVKALHDNHIEVLLDVVYNHTAESDALGPTLSYRGIDNVSYYRLQEHRRYYKNDAGTGNTLNMANPAVLQLGLDSLRYWVEHMGVDGFRFDLASTLARSPDEFDPNGPFLKAYAADPVLSAVKSIAEPWDIGPGGYQLGAFPSGWSEWNDRYRDDVRRFWRGEPMAHQALAGRLLGSADIFDHSDRRVFSSVNFITSHDGFTLRDLVSYNHKHNQANGEDNHDGHDHNLSDNMGMEGPSDKAEIVQARLQRQKNMLATLFLSQGTPMILAGDELGHSQGGNNNSYCQDNVMTWLGWADHDTELKDFVAKLGQIRRDFVHFRQGDFLHGTVIDQGPARNIVWLAPDGKAMRADHWESDQTHCLAMVLNVKDHGAVMLVINRGGACHFASLADAAWRRELTTAKKGIKDAIIPANSVSVFSRSDLFLTQDAQQAALADKAADYGFVSSYRDISGHVHHAEPASLAALLSLIDKDPPCTDGSADQDEPIIYGAQMLQQLGPVWGVTCGLYSLHSKESWGIGDFEDLACLAENLARQGADFIGLNPVHALFPAAPELYSPYSPSSREFLNIMHIAPHKIPECTLARPARFHNETAQQSIDYAAVYRAKRRAFSAAYKRFCALADDHPRQVAFNAFVRAKGPGLMQHALFETLFERLPPAQRSYAGWKAFPKAYHDPNSAACQAFADKHRARLNYHAYLQWIAHDQLKAAQSRARVAGMRIGLYLDFAVGVVPGGSDAWRYQSSYVQGASLGAPGDMANPAGQMWNLLPFNPHALVQDDYAPLRRALAHNMSLAGALRIDHVLGLSRSFWLPQSGGSGVYMRYPWKGLMSVIAEQSQAHQCLVIGEDLGTVPDGFRDKMAKHDMLGCDLFIAQRRSDGQLEQPQDQRRLALMSFTNHDFPTACGYWRAEDIALRARFDLIGGPEGEAHARHQRDAEKAELSHRLGMAEVPLALDASLMADLQSYLATSPSLAFAITLEDLLCDIRQPNLPGIIDAYPNWRIRARLSLEEMEQDPAVAAILSRIHRVRRAPLSI